MRKIFQKIFGMRRENEEDFIEEIQIGKIHETGKRAVQQDCFGIGRTGSGLIVAMADGMGGLEKGEMVSRKMVQLFLQYAEQTENRDNSRVLWKLTEQAAAGIDDMLGEENLCKSGSTFIAVLVEQKQFHWISVGDSRIYLYREDQIRKLNQDHIYEAELMEMAEQGIITLEEAKRNPQRERLTSFIGMGKLKYIDGSGEGKAIREGDRILLVTDGIYKTLPEEKICRILRDNPDAKAAARQIQAEIEAADHPYQDNYTAVILGL